VHFFGRLHEHLVQIRERWGIICFRTFRLRQITACGGFRRSRLSHRSRPFSSVPTAEASKKLPPSLFASSVCLREFNILCLFLSYCKRQCWSPNFQAHHASLGFSSGCTTRPCLLAALPAGNKALTLRGVSREPPALWPVSTQPRASMLTVAKPPESLEVAPSFV
jgi:hypothetical protein